MSKEFIKEVKLQTEEIKTNEKTLTEELSEYARMAVSKLDKDIVNTMQNDVNKLKEEKILNNSIKLGENIPNVELLDVFNQKIELNTNGKSLVIMFYRGGWCPYCNLELRAYQSYVSKFRDQGAELVAISPELADESLNTKQKHELDFKVLSDVDNKFAKSLGLVHKVSQGVQDIYNEFDFNLASAQGNSGDELPFPATLVIDKNRKVTLIEANEDYKVRMDPKDVLKHLEDTK